jgi:hypothetical protein
MKTSGESTMNPTPIWRQILTPMLGLALIAQLSLGLVAFGQESFNENNGRRDRRKALLAEFSSASTARRRAILSELHRMKLAETEGRSYGRLKTENVLPSASDIDRWFGAPELSSAVGLGAVLADDGELSDRDIQKILGLVAKDGITPEERNDLNEVVDLYGDTLTEDTIATLEHTYSEEDRVSYTLSSNNPTWTSSYFPMAGSGIDDEGSSSKNLWAKDGAMNKIDRVIEARTGTPGTALETERRPALNFLVNKPRGFYIPNSRLDEKDAERTTGVDLNGNGKIDEDLEWDFIDKNGRFRKDGKTESTLGVGWWGRCNNVGVAGTLFKEPKHPVTIDGVTFSPTEIKGLLAVFSDTIVDAKGAEFVGNRNDKRADELVTTDGKRVTGYVENVGELDFHGPGSERSTNWSHRGDYVVLDNEALVERGKEIRIRNLETGEVDTFKPEDVRSLSHEDKEQDTEARVFHNTMTEWLADGRAGVLEMDPGHHVWNYNFESAAIVESTTPPSWATDRDKLRGYGGPPGDGEVTYFDSTVKYNGADGTQHYRYWLEKDASGNVVNSGWSGKNTDFMWRARETEVDWSRSVSGHPSLDGDLIRELYEKSTTDPAPAPVEPASPAPVEPAAPSTGDPIEENTPGQ